MGRPRKSTPQAKETPKAKTKEAREPEEETENLSLTLTRSRRIPKPNPKYSNDVIVPFSSRVTGDDSSRSTSPANSETSEEVVPPSEDDDEDELETPKPGTRKRGRPPKKQILEPLKKLASSHSRVVKQKEPAKNLTPERQGKQVHSLDVAAKRKRDDETIATVDAVVKKRIRALEEKLKTVSQPHTRSVEKKVPGLKAGSPTKGEYIDVEGTAENVKIVDVSEILSKKHELLVNEPKRLRKCPPEAHKISPRTPYGSKILNQSPKVIGQTTKLVTPLKLAPVTQKINPKISPKTTPPPLITRQQNNGKINSVPRLSDTRKGLTSASKCTVIDLTEASNSLEKPKRALKEALVASTGVRKPPQTVPLRPISALQKTGNIKSQLMTKPSAGSRPPPLISRPPPLITRGLSAKTKISETRSKREITSIELWSVVRLPTEAVEESPKITLGMTLNELTAKIKDIQLPSEAWSHSVKKNTEPLSSIAFKFAKPNEPTKERSVTFNAAELIIEIEGNEVVFVGAPDNLATPSDVQTLLEIVNDVSMKNSCVETVAVVL